MNIQNVQKPATISSLIWNADLVAQGGYCIGGKIDISDKVVFSDSGDWNVADLVLGYSSEPLTYDVEIGTELLVVDKFKIPFDIVTYPIFDVSKLDLLSYVSRIGSFSSTFIRTDSSVSQIKVVRDSTGDVLGLKNSAAFVNVTIPADWDYTSDTFSVYVSSNAKRVLTLFGTTLSYPFYFNKSVSD